MSKSSSGRLAKKVVQFIQQRSHRTFLMASLGFPVLNTLRVTISPPITAGQITDLIKAKAGIPNWGVVL